MAPVTRSSHPGATSLLREGSWQFANNDEAEQASSSSDEEPETHSVDGQENSTMASPRLSANQDLSQLEITADRVTRQAEQFARSLDKFVASKPDARSERTWRDAQSMLKTFQSNAQSNAKSAPSNRQSRSSSKGHSKSRSSSRNNSDAHHFREEAETWELLNEVVQLQSPMNQANVVRHQSKALHGLSRYSSDPERWDAFLLADGYAQEAVAIILWLQRTADASGASIEDLTQDLRYRSERGDGIWSSGWLYTRETIKGYKRLRSWSRSIDLEERQDINISRKTDGASLVTQLDPDAALRQNRERCEEDNFHEAANWQSCWELLRRGKSWSYVRDYWAQRHEEWHSASLLGELPGNDTETPGESLSWMKAYGSGRMWTLTCRALSGEDGIDSHEAAVYALLSSDFDRSKRVCHTVDDFLFALLTSLVLERYDRFCRALDMKLQTPTAKTKNSYEPAPTKECYDRLRTCVTNLRLRERIGTGVSEPLKMIQIAVACKNYSDFFARQGRSTAKLNQANNNPNAFTIDPSSVPEVSAIDTDGDPESMRTLVHVQLVLQALGYFDGEQEQVDFMDNNIISYMLWLQKVGKVELIPLYASRLSLRNTALALGPILVNVTTPKEREIIVGLLRKYEISLPNVLAVMFEQLYPDRSVEVAVSQLRQVNIFGNRDPQHPRQLTIRTGTITGELSSEEHNLIRCLEWHRWIDVSAWDQCCLFATIAIKYFILQGRLSAARALLDQAGLQELSCHVVQVDLSQDESSAEASEAEQSPAKRSLPAQHETSGEMSLDVQLMKNQAQTWKELEELILILSAFEDWAEVVEQTEEHQSDPKLITKCKLALSKSLEAVQTFITPCIAPNWLRLPITADEAPLLHAIRTYYLPEILLGLTSVFYFAGNFLSRDYFAECMQIAITIASTDGLAETVQEAKRMREILNQLAGASKALLLANERSPRRRPKEGATVNVDIWQVKPDEVGLEKKMGRAK